MLRAPPEDVCGQYARTVHLWGPSRSPRVHRGPGADALASSQSFWLVWLPSHEELHRLGRRAVALPGPAWSGKSIHKVAERDSGSPLRTLPWCPVRGVAAQTQRATDRDPRSTPPRTGGIGPGDVPLSAGARAAPGRAPLSPWWRGRSTRGGRCDPQHRPLGREEHQVVLAFVSAGRAGSESLPRCPPAPFLEQAKRQGSPR